jgi:hypothetical protein
LNVCERKRGADWGDILNIYKMAISLHVHKENFPLENEKYFKLRMGQLSFKFKTSKYLIRVHYSLNLSTNG